MRKKWRIEGLDRDKPLEKMARLIIRDRLRQVLAQHARYVTSRDPEALHQLRIALRRLRYPLETVYDCFPKDLRKRFYTLIDDVQEHTGQVRDLDVLMEYLDSLTEHRIEAEIWTELRRSRENRCRDVDERLNRLPEEPALIDFCRLLDLTEELRACRQAVKASLERAASSGEHRREDEAGLVSPPARDGHEEPLEE
ncbi:conserved hypothetical protein [Heliomicrobium modesticaldum Ice1]|uniref:CHAD domain-containing protein n=1 Tax=Heliobacterium modesticaldum (strain ATCC 51547 / Ice1) TaxID=498761 RepID=B0TC32_HELMI|nr:CHAD domain-containing protein [Heliomicrobium modesticaldum]ABZ85305.1 conserved hypothetical protein [Heliomicrobium modesticaldum Ice1]